MQSQNNVMANFRRFAGPSAARWAEIHGARAKSLWTTIRRKLWGILVLVTAIGLSYLDGFRALPFLVFRDNGATWWAGVVLLVSAAWTLLYLSFIMRDGAYPYEARGNRSVTVYVVGLFAWLLAWVLVLPVMAQLGTLSGVVFKAGMIIFGAVHFIPMFATGALSEQAEKDAPTLVNALLMLAAAWYMLTS